MKSYNAIVLLIVAALLCITPALGAEKYIGGPRK